MVFFNVTLFVLFFGILSCGKSQSNDVPILLSQKDHLLYILNEENQLIRYDVNDEKIMSRESLSNVSFPVNLFVYQQNLSQKIILFSNGGVNYKIISPNDVNDYFNKSFSHISDVVNFNDNILVNTVNGLYICFDSLQILRRLYCNNNDSTCDINLSVIDNRFIVLSEIDNLQRQTSIRIFDSSYNERNRLLVDGVVKTKIHFFNDRLSRYCYVKEKLDKIYFTIANNTADNDDEQILLKGFQSGSDIFIDSNFIYYDGTYFRCIDIKQKNEKWKLPYNKVMEIVHNHKYICIQSDRGIDIIDYSGGIVYSANLISAFTPVLFENYIIIFDYDKGIVRIAID